MLHHGASYWAEGEIPSLEQGLRAEDKAHIALLTPFHVQDWASKKIEEYTELLRALKAVYNAAAPINRKSPPELLVEVFSHLKPGSTVDRDTFVVLTVCRTWRSLVLRTSAFWTDLLEVEQDFVEGPLDRKVARLGLYLRLSRTQSLQLILYGCLLLSSTLCPYAHRIISLEISIGVQQVNWFNLLLLVGMPLLRQLSIHHLENESDADGQQVPVLDIDPQRLPRLRSLRLPCHSFTDIVAGACREFLRLDLFACNCKLCRDNPRTSEALFNALRACVSLNTLNIQDCDMNGGSPTRAIDLPALRRLFICADPELVSTLLSHLSAPPTCVLDLGRPAHTFRAQLPRNLASFLPVSTADCVSFHHEANLPSRHILETSTNGFRTLCMVVSQGPDHHPFATLVNELAEMLAPFRNITTFTLKTPLFFSLRDENRRAFHSLLGSLPQLTSLDIPDFDDSEGGALSVVGELTPDGADLCPLLEHLHIRWAFDLQPFLRTKDVWAALEGRSPARHVTGPAMLALFCDMVVGILEARAAHGLVLKTLLISVVPCASQKGIQWEERIAVEGERLRTRLLGMTESVCIRPFCDRCCVRLFVDPSGVVPPNL